MMYKGYQKLCTEFYEHSKPEAGPRELAFYEKFLEKSQGPFLEAMCGTGRLMIPLVRKGFEIEGVDNSQYMLDICSSKCKSENLHPSLYLQSLQNLSLGKQYSIIFIAVGSFQLIENSVEALKALHKLREHLLPGGFFLIETFVPWDGVKAAIEESSLLDSSSAFFERKEVFQDGSEIIFKGTTTDYQKEQLQITEGQYLKIQNGNVVEAEEEKLAVRWYYRHEMELILEKSGFSEIQIWDESFELNPQAVIYQAFKALSERSEFSAWRSAHAH